MATSTSSQFDQEYVLICGVEPEVSGGIEELLADCPPRFTYEGGMVQMSRVVDAVSPETYRRFMELLPEHYLRHNYDGFTLEMMTPRKPHQWVAAILRRFVQAMSYDLDIPIRSLGSTTLASASGDVGIQPDDAFYIAHGERVRGREAPGADDPPPDLVTDVEVAGTVVSRLSAYARIGVPEIWERKHEEIRFLRLGERGKYEPRERSIAFPWILPADVDRFLSRRHETDEGAASRRTPELNSSGSRPAPRRNPQ